MRNIMIYQHTCKLALFGFVATILVAQHLVEAMSIYKQKLINSSQAAKKHRYQAFSDDQSALEMNEISRLPRTSAEGYMFVPHTSYETNEHSHKMENHKLIANSIGENHSTAREMDEHKAKSSSIDGNSHKATTHKQDCHKILEALQQQFVEQVIKQRVVDADHLLMEKWLVDNVNDLHRELKQTEMDFEHYVQVTKKMLAHNDLERDNYLLKRELAMQTALPLSFPLRTIAVHQEQDSSVAHNHHNRQHLRKLLLSGH